MPKSPCWDRVSGDVHVKNSTTAPLELAGVPVSDLDMWRLCRALDGTSINVMHDNSSGPELIYQIIGANIPPTDLYMPSSTHLIKRRSSPEGEELVLHNHGYYLIEKYRGKGHVWAALALQVEAAHRLGFSRIETMAVGHHPSHILQARAGARLTQRVGAIQWPKLGFDGPIPDTFWNSITTDEAEDLGLQRGDLISKLGATKQGSDLWASHHADMTMTLQLRPLSIAAQNLLALTKTMPKSVRRV